jgi:hypothetical protein
VAALYLVPAALQQAELAVLHTGNYTTHEQHVHLIMSQASNQQYFSLKKISSTVLSTGQTNQNEEAKFPQSFSVPSRSIGLS